MAVRSLKNSTIENFANYSSSMNAGYSFQDYELIESVFVASPAASVTFNNLNQYATEYKHLQIRVVGRLTFSDPERTISLYVNGDTASNYSHHGLYGTGSSVASYSSTSTPKIDLGSFAANNATANAFGAAIVDFLDAYSSTKNKTIKTFNGSQTTPHITLRSGLWRSTTPLSSITLYDPTSNIAPGSRFSLYGIR